MVRLPRRMKPLISMSMTARETSSANGTKCKGVAQTNSPVNMSTVNWPCDAFDASVDGRRRGPYDETSRKAGCGKSARPVVCPVKAGVFSRRQTCRGKSQAPRSLDGRVEGNQDSEAHRQGLPRGDHESPGRNESERASGLENEWIRGPSLQLKGEGSMGCRNLTDAAP